MKKILIINNHDSFVYNLVQLIAEASCIDYEICTNDNIPFDKLSQYSGFLLSPGPGLPSQSGDLMKLITECKHSHAFLGVCLGHQALAEAFGGKLKQLTQPFHGHQSHISCSPDSEIFKQCQKPVLVGRYHSWSVEPSSVPCCFKTSAIDDSSEIMAIEHKSLPIWGVQFHPESYMSNCGADIINAWLKLLP